MKHNAGLCCSDLTAPLKLFDHQRLGEAISSCPPFASINHLLGIGEYAANITEEPNLTMTVLFGGGGIRNVVTQLILQTKVHYTCTTI